MLRFVERQLPVPLWSCAFFLLLTPIALPLLNVLRLLDSGICAQLPTHMLAPGGVTLPLCARNTGIYAGVALAFGMLRARGRQRAMLPPTPAVITLLLSLIGVMALDGFNSVATDLALPHLYAPTNNLRLASGLGAGLALALLLAPVIARARYGGQDRRAPVAGIVALLPFAATAAVAFLIIRSGAPWTLYPVALLSNAGLLAVLVGVNRVAFSGLAGHSGTETSAGASLPLATLLPLCVAELALLAGMKLLILGPAPLAM
ncbi:MAG TPA: DUF2085 domain-containing protein [Chloroflexota bacterium]|nr:DUF2085 domain-containing protein [Chloroflexota bacterium]